MNYNYWLDDNAHKYRSADSCVKALIGIFGISQEAAKISLMEKGYLSEDGFWAFERVE